MIRQLHQTGKTLIACRYHTDFPSFSNDVLLFPIDTKRGGGDIQYTRLLTYLDILYYIIDLVVVPIWRIQLEVSVR